MSPDRSRHEIISYEVLLGLRRLVTKYGPELTTEWDWLHQILRTIRRTLPNATSNLSLVLQETVQVCPSCQC